MKIAIASGKGGTGKSTISTNLAWLLSNKGYKKICLVDCDVEEPNCHIFLKPKFNFNETIFVPIPQIDKEKCTLCGKCVRVCQYNSLVQIKDTITLFPELCHSCGSCTLICQKSAIKEINKEIGIIKSGIAYDFNFIYGELKIGEAMSPPLINQLKQYVNKTDFNIQILDCPPGTTCPMIAAIDGVDFVILVTEPTPFGLYDLTLAVEVIRKINLPFAVIINRSGENDKLIENYTDTENIKVLTKIPNSRIIAESYSKGNLFLNEIPNLQETFMPLINLIKRMDDE